MKDHILKESLLRKLRDEQDQYVAVLKKESPDQVLLSAREYVSRQDIVTAFLEVELDEQQMKVLLDEKDLLEALYRVYVHADTDAAMSIVEDTILNLVDIRMQEDKGT